MKTNVRKERGGVIVEAVILLPLLLLAILGISDLYFYADAYMSLTHTSREALMSASGLTGFQGTRTTLPVTLADYQQCMASPSTNSDCGHKIVQWRIQRLVESHHPRIDSKTLTVSTMTENAPDGPLVGLSVSARYLPVSSVSTIFGTFSVRSSAKMYQLARQG